ncbi:alpha/beta fold hydrolase [Phenylobacterium sp.]|uniref:alpha/beta fold hydrolase n=1 Tax=Phenylobacterium sp. TaxID=1871053 RepID=UPI0035B4E40D
MDQTIRTISLNGVTLGYSVHGDGSGKPPLVFVHGYCVRSTGGPYEQLIDLLADRYTVYALDLRGHGASAGALEGWSVEALADDVVAFSRALGLGAPVYVGHSLGGFTGVFAEIRHPGAFAALCLLTPAAATVTGDTPAETMQLLVEHGRDRDMMREMFRHMFVRAPGRMLEAVIDAVTMVDGEVHRMFLETSADLSIDERLGEVEAPVLLLNGERDVVVAPARQHDMARRLARSKEVVFSTEGHMLPNEGADVAAREILSFLDFDRAPMAAAALVPAAG